MTMTTQKDEREKEAEQDSNDDKLAYFCYGIAAGLILGIAWLILLPLISIK